MAGGRGRRALLLGATSAAFLAACGKSRREPPPLTWFDEHDLDNAYARAVRLGRPLLIMFGATWDTASKEYEHVTFMDPEVAGRMATDFVIAHVDVSDDENALTTRLMRRYDVIGSPTLLILDPRSDLELWRASSYYHPPKAFVTALDDARARHAAIVVDRPPRLHWGSEPDATMREAIARNRPLLLFFGPAYDHGSKRVRDECFTSPWVARILYASFVLCDVPSDEGSNEHWERFGVRGTPASIAVDPARNRELLRLEQTTRPEAYARFLRNALAQFRA